MKKSSTVVAVTKFGTFIDKCPPAKYVIVTCGRTEAGLEREIKRAQKGLDKVYQNDPSQSAIYQQSKESLVGSVTEANRTTIQQKRGSVYRWVPSFGDARLAHTKALKAGYFAYTFKVHLMEVQTESLLHE